MPRKGKKPKLKPLHEGTFYATTLGKGGYEEEAKAVKKREKKAKEPLGPAVKKALKRFGNIAKMKGLKKARAMGGIGKKKLKYEEGGNVPFAGQGSNYELEQDIKIREPREQETNGHKEYAHSAIDGLIKKNGK